jgi:hypothetical protein
MTTNSSTPEVGTARWHLREAGICLAAARKIFDARTGSADQDGIMALSTMAQAHAAMSVAINAQPGVRSVWMAAE